MNEAMITHREYEVRYSDNEDVWRCYALDVEDSSLRKVKEKIDKLLLKVRKESAVDVLIIDGRETSVSITEGRALDARVKTSRTFGATSAQRNVSLGVFSNRNSSERGGKSFYRLESLALPTDATFAAIDNARRMGEAAKAAVAAFKESVAAIPRVTEEDVAGLIKAATETHEV